MSAYNASIRNNTLNYFVSSTQTLTLTAINSVPFAQYIAAQYCMTCIDQTYNHVLTISDNEATMIDYKNKFTTSKFANTFDGSAIHDLVSGNA